VRLPQIHRITLVNQARRTADACHDIIHRAQLRIGRLEVC
jgi:hypothetical protein